MSKDNQASASHIDAEATHPEVGPERGHVKGGLTTKQPVPSVTTGIPEGAQVVSVQFPIERLECAECAGRIQQALGGVPGVQRAFVNPESRMATVIYDRYQTGLQQMAEAARQAGYQVGSATERIGIGALT